MSRRWFTRARAKALAVIAVAALATTACAPAEKGDGSLRVKYGTDSPRQYGDVYLPPKEKIKGYLPLIVFIHGGGWLQKSTNTSTAHLAADLAKHGAAVWNIEYRGSDVHAKDKDGIGGWPMTFQDVAKAIDFIPELAKRLPVDIDLGRVSVAGISAGGNLAAWACSRPVLSDNAPGANPTFTVTDCAGIAGVYDLNLAYQEHDKYVKDLLGGSPTEVPERYALASPALNVAPRSRLVILHGRNDRVVNVHEAEQYVETAREDRQTVDIVLLDDADHNSWGRIDGPQWQVARHELLEQLFIF